MKCETWRHGDGLWRRDVVATNNMTYGSGDAVQRVTNINGVSAVASAYQTGGDGVA